MGSIAQPEIRVAGLPVSCFVTDAALKSLDSGFFNFKTKLKMESRSLDRDLKPPEFRGGLVGVAEIVMWGLLAVG